MRSILPFIAGVLMATIFYYYYHPKTVPAVPSAPVAIVTPPLAVATQPEKTIEQRMSEKEQELQAIAADKISQSVLPIQKSADSRLNAFREDLSRRMEQDALTLARRQITPNRNKVRDYTTELERGINSQVGRYKDGKITDQYNRHYNGDRSSITDFRNWQRSLNQKKLDAFKAQLDSNTEDLIARFKKARTEKNQEKINDYTHKLDAIVAAGRKVYKDYENALTMRDIAKYRAELEGKKTISLAEVAQPKFTPNFPDPVDPDKGKFIYQNFK